MGDQTSIKHSVTRSQTFKNLFIYTLRMKQSTVFKQNLWNVTCFVSFSKSTVVFCLYWTDYINCINQLPLLHQQYLMKLFEPFFIIHTYHRICVSQLSYTALLTIYAIKIKGCVRCVCVVVCVGVCWCVWGCMWVCVCVCRGVSLFVRLCISCLEVWVETWHWG